MHRYTHFAASFIILAVILAVLFPVQTQQTMAAEEMILLPEGGRLEALDERGETIGPCPLRHTDVDVQIAGHFSRVTVTQIYHNPYDQKIEAVYTFPLSHRGAVDRMTMIIGDRVIQGEVKERAQARQIYEAARGQGYVASLLEQERPNIFTQSVANIEPGAEIEIRISYVEVLESIDGEYRFAFPMVVAPRYIPGRSDAETFALPEGLEARRGVILLGPATLEGDETLGAARLKQLLARAIPIHQPPASWWDDARQPRILHHFDAQYPTGAKEFGMLYDQGVGQLNGRWFAFAVESLNRGGGFAPDTDQVPDASRITPMPTRPENRAGHDIAVRVTLDTGGPGIRDIASPQHAIRQQIQQRTENGAPRRVTVSLKNERDIPNRDFILTWRQADDRISEAVFTHTGEYADYKGGFFTLILAPPARVPDELIRPREIIFVLDNSGSMLCARARLDRSGVSALDAAKRVISQAIDTMRPDDRFNIISFNHTLDVLWDEPQPNTPQNRDRAQQYVDQRQGGGGTEMRNAVLKALEAGPFARTPDADEWLSPRDVLNLPADGREVKVAAAMDNLRSIANVTRYEIVVDDELRLALEMEPMLLSGFLSKGVMLHLTGDWTTRDGRRVLLVREAEQAPMLDDAASDEPMRIVLFVTDGLVGNDEAIIRAVRENAHRTRVFTIGMSRSPNRSLLDEMAIVGRGAADYVLPDDDVEPIVQRFTDRIATPVLTDISLSFSDELNVFDVVPSADRLPDLFDVQPLVVHGRYTADTTARGVLTIQGLTGAGRYERTLDMELPASQPEHDVIATLWARSKVDELRRDNRRDAIIALGESFQIMTEYTSFVAVEKARVTVGGRPLLVRVPIEFPKDMSWEGVFGSSSRLTPGEGEADLLRALRKHGHFGAVAEASLPSLDKTVLRRAPSEAEYPALREPAQQRPAVRTRQTLNEPSAPAAVEPAPYRQRDIGSGAGGLGGGGGGGDAVWPNVGRDVSLDDSMWSFTSDAKRAFSANESLLYAASPPLARKLDRRLLQLLTIRDAVYLSHARILVTVLLRDLDEETIAAIEAIGFDVEAIIERGTFLIGYVPLSRLPSLALHDAVRRIELVESDRD